MKNEIWKVATVLLIFLILGLSIILYFQEKNYMEIQGLVISKENFAILNEANSEGEYILCSIPQNKCVGMLKQKLP